MSGLAPQTPGVPKTGPCAHDLSREQEFGGRLRSALSRFGTAAPPSPFKAPKTNTTT
jgi:hypothetical protein